MSEGDFTITPCDISAERFSWRAEPSVKHGSRRTAVVLTRVGLSRLGRTDWEHILAADRLTEVDIRRLVGTVGLYRLHVGE